MSDSRRLKILHISTSDAGGAGQACLRLHKGLRAQGYHSSVLVLDKRGSEVGVYRYEHRRSQQPKLLVDIVAFLARNLKRIDVSLSPAERYRRRLGRLRQKFDLCFTLPISDIDLVAHPLVCEADIIHLHWVEDFLDYPSFFKKIDKPIVWTVHDENLYMGGFHHRRLRDESVLLYGQLEEELATMKRESVAQCKNLTIVSLSETMRDLSLAHPIVRDRKHYLIHNGVDPLLSRPTDRRVAREILSLSQDKTVVLFVSRGLSDPNKGFGEMVQAVRALNRQDIVLYVIGKASDGLLLPTGPDIMYAGLIDDSRFLSVAYSAADVLVVPSFQEAFALTPLEAMACGLPVVAFPFSGTTELINEKNGVRTIAFTVNALAEGIRTALAKTYDHEWIRQDVIERFGMQKIVSQYIDLYRQVLE